MWRASRRSGGRGPEIRPVHRAPSGACGRGAGSLARVFLTMPTAEVARRLPRLLLGLLVGGTGIGLTIRAELGLAPWDVLHQGLAERAGLTVGTAVILVGLVVLVSWLPLRERFGVGTVLNVVLIGLVVDATLAAVPVLGPLPVRWAVLVAGILALGVGTGLYIGAGLGPGPRDGLMTALARRGRSVRMVRTGIEASALVAGWALGGEVGVGTVLVAVAVGPVVHYALERLTIPSPGAGDVPLPSVTPSSVT